MHESSIFEARGGLNITKIQIECPTSFFLESGSSRGRFMECFGVPGGRSSRSDRAQLGLGQGLDVLRVGGGGKKSSQGFFLSPP